MSESENSESTNTKFAFGCVMCKNMISATEEELEKGVFCPTCGGTVFVKKGSLKDVQKEYAKTNAEYWEEQRRKSLDYVKNEIAHPDSNDRVFMKSTKLLYIIMLVLGWLFCFAGIVFFLFGLSVFLERGEVAFVSTGLTWFVAGMIDIFFAEWFRSFSRLQLRRTLACEKMAGEGSKNE